MQDAKRKLIEEATRHLIDRGKIIEAGWMTYRSMMSATAPPIQLRECRLAFYHGCSFLMQAMTHAVSEGKEATKEDLQRMHKLHSELEAFEEQFKLQRSSEAAKFTCPRCGAMSYNINDIKNGYCGACHDWTREPQE